LRKGKPSVNEVNTTRLLEQMVHDYRKTPSVFQAMREQKSIWMAKMDKDKYYDWFSAVDAER